MKKIIMIALVAILCVVAFACTPAQEAPAEPASEAPASEAPAEEPATEAPASEEPVPAEEAPAEGGTIVFYGFSDWMDTEPYKASYEAAKAQFESENPGFTVELQSDPWGDWEQKYKTMFAAGSPADVFMVNNPDFPTFANSGNLLDMSAHVDAGYFDGFFPGITGMYMWQGANMAIPFTTDCRILWYNKEIFEEAGLDPEVAPKTWEELVSMANQITENTGKYGFGMDLGLQEFPTQSLYCASTGSIINVAEDGSITPNVNTDEFKGYLDTLLSMKDTFEPDYTVLTHHDVAKLFAEGQMGIIIGNTLVDTDIYDKDWYAQALVPSIDGATNGAFGGGFGISVSSNCAYPEQAVKFAQLLCSPEYCAKLISDIPASDAGIANSEMASDPKFDVYFDQIQYARQAQPKTLYYAEIDMAVYDAVSEMLVGGAAIDDVVAGLETTITEIVGG